MLFTTCVFIGFLEGVTNAAFLNPDQQLRIIGGVEAPEAYSPHMVALIRGERTPSLLCGGSIISSWLVITAAHCIDNVVESNGQLTPSFHLRVSSNQWNSGGLIVQVAKYHNHPQWDPKNIKYDVGVLVLKKKLVFSDYLTAVELNFEKVGEERSLVTGWGRTGPTFEGNIVNLQPTPNDLQLIYVNTITHEQCQRQMSQVSGQTWTPHIQKDIEICTFHSRGHGMCVGDSGSALLLQNTRQQIGLVSWGFGCADGAPDVFVRLHGVRQFVETLLDVYKD